MTDERNAEQTQSEAAETQTPDIETLQAELNKARDDMLRALAEAENTRRRAERQVADARAYAIDRFAGDLLPIADTLSRALLAAPRDDADDSVRNLITGVELTERSLLDVFAKHGLKRVGEKGETFNPNLHQAVAQAPSDYPSGVVAEVMQSGFVLGDRTLRAAMVLVSTGPAVGTQSSSGTIDIKV